MSKRLDLRRGAWLALSLLVVAACSSSDPDTETDSPAASGGSSAGSSGSSSTAGSSSNAGSSSSAGGRSGAGGSDTAGSSGGRGGGGGSGAGGGSGGASGSGVSGGSGSVGPPPSPTEDGLAIYTVECAGESSVCNYPEAACLGIYLDEGGVGYACSNQCNSVEDCSDAPSGADAAVGCVQFTSAKRCVLVCYDGGVESECPNGMGCYRYPNSPIGYCLWL